MKILSYTTLCSKLIVSLAPKRRSAIPTRNYIQIFRPILFFRQNEATNEESTNKIYEWKREIPINNPDDGILSSNKLLPIWPNNRRSVTMSPVAKKIINMSAILSDLLKDEDLRLTEIKSIKEIIGKSKQAISLIENRCQHREGSLISSRKKNLELLNKLLLFVKEKENFDDTLKDQLSGIFEGFKPYVKQKPVKKKPSLSKSYIFLMPEPTDEYRSNI